ncbi:hypothetical protein LDC_0372, partial [sediment metagenome]
MLLAHTAQIGRAHVEAFLRQHQGLVILGHDTAEHCLASLGRELGRQCVLDLAERASTDAAVFSDCLFLLGGADFHLRLQCPAREDWQQQARARTPHRVVAILQHEQLARDVADVGRECNARHR